MDTWKKFLLSYVGLGIIVTIVIFRLRHTYSPQRTELMPSILASFVSGMAWGIVFPLIILTIMAKLFRKGKVDKPK
jgi:xanthosine utilization system XapX-like protein